MINRCKECTNSELSNYYSKINSLNNRISRQAAFKAIKKLNPKVFYKLINKFAEFFYESSLVKTYKGYILLAEDGTSINLYGTDESLDIYGFAKGRAVKDRSDAKKATSRSSALYDVTNGIVVDFSMESYITSEIPMAIKHLDNVNHLFKDKKVIYLADRNYDSVELFSILEHYNMNYCIRAKSNFFKHYIEKMNSNDEWIEVSIDKQWFKRLKYDIPKKRFKDESIIKVRVVKKKYRYVQYGKLIETELIYFTNLNKDEFDTDEIASLYSKRWDIEVSYKTLKTNLEWERYFSINCNIETSSILAKVLFHNITGVFRKEFDKHLEDTAVIDEDNKAHLFKINIKQLINVLRDENLLRWIRNKNLKNIENIFELIKSIIHKLKVPVRANRHVKRWGRVVTSSHPYRFRLDGRNWPNTISYQGILMTMKPI